jgi:hypothetical protein
VARGGWDERMREGQREGDWGFSGTRKGRGRVRQEAEREGRGNGPGRTG